MAQKATPVTKIRIQVPKGTKVEDLVSKLEITFEEAKGSGIEFNSNHCCVDASIVSPVSTVSRS
jgi:hypothetical protein